MKKPRAGENVGTPRQVEDFGGPAFIHRAAAYPWQPLFLALLVAGLLLLTGWRASRWYEERLMTDQRAQVEAQLVPYGNALTFSVNRRLAQLDALAAFAQTHSTEAELATDWATFAAGLHASAIGIRGLQVYGPAGPNHIYPLQGNEATVGRRLSDLINDTRPDVRADVQRTIETRRIALSAPYELRQGGLGLVGRLAVYRGETLWGVVVVVLDLPPILAEAGIVPELAGLQMALRDGAGGNISEPAAVFAAQPMSYRVTLPEGDWELAALPVGGWEAGIRDARRLFQAVMWILALLAAALTYLATSREAQLTTAVRARTQELSAANRALEQEVGQHRQAAETLREKDTLLHLTGEMGKIGGWEFDTETRRGAWSDAVARIHDLDPATETNVELGVSFYTGESRARIEAAIQAAVTAGTPYDLELELTTARGAHKWVRTIGRPIVAAGRVAKVQGTFQDITDRKRAEDALRQLNAELEQRVADRTAELSERVGEVERLNRAMTNLLEDLQAANRQATEAAERLRAANAELETFTYSVSHDLKAPLRGIDGYSRLLAEDYMARLDEDGRKFLQNIRRAATQMSQLIDDLLTYSRLERRTLNRAAVNPAALAATLVAERAEEARARGVRLTVEVACTSVIAEPEGLTQALRNLLDNALKFTRDVPAAAITLSGRETESSCILWVADNGPGFDMKYAERIFEIFQRLHRAEDYPGTGIGLAIVRKAMQRMGGRAWAESEPGKGATFYLEIPK